MKPNSAPLTIWLAALTLLTTMLACKFLEARFSPAPTLTASSTPVTPTATGTASPTPLPPTETATPTETEAPSEPCQAVTISEVTIYQRPSTSAEAFSSVPAGFRERIYARTDSGWVGFDPGVAQAANIGSFRLRWLEPDKVTLTGECESLPVVWAPPPGICFDMPMWDVEVHSKPNSTSPILWILKPEQFAAVIGVTDSGWAMVDLGPGNTGESIQGWVERPGLNVNGPCQDLPTLSE